MANLAIGMVGIFSMLLIAAGLLKSQPRHPIPQIFFLITLCVAAYVVAVLGVRSIESAYRVDYSNFIYFVRIAPFAIPGLFMIFCHLVFQGESKLPSWAAAIFTIQLLLSSTLQISFHILENPPAFIADQKICEFLSSVNSYLVLSVSGVGSFWAVKGLRNDIAKRRKKTRGLLLSFWGFLLFTVATIENVIVTPETIIMLAQQLTIAIVALLGFILVLVMSSYEDLLAITDVSKSGSDPKFTYINSIKASDNRNFRRRFVDDCLYTDPSLTMSSLAKELKIPEYRLRSFITKELGYRNFNSMLHAYRIDDICTKLSSDQFRDTPISKIAFDSGYRNIASFNTAFRDLKGTTPSEYRSSNTS